MSNKVKDIDIKNRTLCFFSDIINIENVDPNSMKIDETSCKTILIYYIAYVTVKDLKYLIMNSVNLLYLTFNKVNSYFKENNGNKHLMLVPATGNKEKIKNYKELWIKTRDLIRSITKTLDDYDEKYIKIKFHQMTSYL